MSRTICIRPLAAWLILMTVTAPCFGQSKAIDRSPDFPGLDIQAAIGWDGFVSHTSPLTISFLVTNQSEKMLEGELRLKDVISGRSLSLGDLAIGPGGTKRISTIQNLAEWEDCTAEYTDGSTVFWTRSLSLANEKYSALESAVLLVVDEGARKLTFRTATAATPTASGAMLDPTLFLTAVGQGHNVQALSVPGWQIPIHHGPLTAVQAIALTESAKAETLSDAQWDAVGRWVCIGGTVFLHESTPDVLERLKKSCPLAVQPPQTVETFTEHPVGAGRIRVFSGKLFAGEDTTTALALANATSPFPRPAIYKAVSGHPLYMNDAPQSNRTRNWVMLVFGIYTLVSGGVTLLLFRLTRNRLKLYTVSVVGAASVAAVGLGILLRQSQGDVAWTSVTQITDSGAVQLAKIGVRSAGGRNFHLAATGPKVDLQLSESDRLISRYGGYAYYSYDYNSGSMSDHFAPPFSMSTNLTSDKPDVFRIKVPVTPWGEREAIAVGFVESLSGLDVKLEYEPPFGRDAGSGPLTSIDQVESMWSASSERADTDVLNGAWKVEIRNETPFELSNCTLSITKSSVRGYDGSDRPYRQNGYGNAAVPTLQLSDLTHQIGTLEIGAVKKAAAPHDTGMLVANWTGNRYGLSEYRPVSSIRPGGTDVWLIATISESPGLQVDEGASDFQTSNVPRHVILFRLGPERLPESWKMCHDWLLQRHMHAEEQVLKDSTQIQQ